jgi:hypothetical protein
MTLVADFNSSITVPFQRMRQLLEDTALQAGVVGASDLKVVQRGAGANMSVDVGTGQAYVEITSGTRNGLGHVTNDAVANVVVTASNATNPRIDQIILRWNDTSIPTGSGNIPTLAVLTGTATGGATLDNRTGAAALPADTLRLADILVPATSTTVTTANIRDRRLWSRGAYNVITRSTGDYTTASVGDVSIDATNLKPRIECAGGGIAVRISLVSGTLLSVAGTIGFVLMVDGVAHSRQAMRHDTGSAGSFLHMEHWVAPAAGSHTFEFQYSVSAGTATLNANATNKLYMVVEEIVRPNTSNT